MQGRQFGVGMAAGLLAALAVVALSGLTAVPSMAPASNTLSGGTTTSSQTVATLTGSQGALYGVSTTATSQVPPETGLTSSINNSSTAGTSGQSAAPASFTSNLAGIGKLSSLSRVLVIAPIVVAALLGVLIYRLSGRSRKEPDQP